jgi:hypothetical protein
MEEFNSPEKRLRQVRPILNEYMLDKQTQSRVLDNYKETSRMFVSGWLVFNELIKTHNLEAWNVELDVFRLYLASRYKIVELLSSQESQMRSDYDKQLAAFKEFIREGRLEKVDQIVLGSNGHELNISSTKLFLWIKPTIDFELMRGTIESLTPLKVLQPKIKIKTSHGKIYTETYLHPFYRFLTDHVFDKNSTRVDRCKFIEDFVNTFDLNFHLFQSADGAPFYSYLIDRFKGIEKK